jgi:hypothetical protein
MKENTYEKWTSVYYNNFSGKWKVHLIPDVMCFSDKYSKLFPHGIQLEGNFDTEDGAIKYAKIVANVMNEVELNIFEYKSKVTGV